MSENILATIPGEYISQAVSMLPDARDAPDEPRQVEISIPRIDGRTGNRRVRITFKRFRHKARQDYPLFLDC